MPRRTFLGTCAAVALAIRAQFAEGKESVSFGELAKVIGAEAKKRRLTDVAVISQSDAKAILAALESAGWKPKDGATIISATLPDSHLLVQKLRTQNGRVLATKLANMPGGFDRLDHLSRLPDSRQLLERIVDGPDGFLLIDYMLNDPNGSAVGAELSQAPGGTGFNQPTGRLYTLKQLRDRLEQSHRGVTDKPAKNRR